MAWGWMKRKNQSYLALAVGGRSGSGKINSTARDDIVIINMRREDFTMIFKY